MARAIDDDEDGSKNGEEAAKKKKGKQDYQGIDMNERHEVEDIKTGKFKQWKGAIA